MSASHSTAEITIETGVSGDDQQGSFQNARMTVLGQHAVSIAVEPPESISELSGNSKATFLQKALLPLVMAGCLVEVELGPDQGPSRPGRELVSHDGLMTIRTGICGDDQQSSFENACLSVRGKHAVSIAVEPPERFEEFAELELAGALKGIFGMLEAGFRVTVQMGPDEAPDDDEEAPVYELNGERSAARERREEWHEGTVLELELKCESHSSGHIVSASRYTSGDSTRYNELGVNLYDKSGELVAEALFSVAEGEKGAEPVIILSHGGNLNTGNELRFYPLRAERSQAIE